MSIIYFASPNDVELTVKKVLNLAKKKFNSEKVGIKVHFGEENNTTHLPAKYFDGVKDFFKDAYYVETNVLYKGRRTITKDHLKIAHEHGFTNLPIKILDGNMGMDYTPVSVNQKNITKAKIAFGLNEFENLISFAHFKGHIGAGFGGTIKNITMGLAARPGKLEMHSSVSPVISSSCNACNECAENCDVDAITVESKARIDDTKCIGCSMCIAICPIGAISPAWGSESNTLLIERMAEYGLATIKKNWIFVNFLTNMTTMCDCMGVKQEPFIDDVGILVSEDPIAIDQASIDLIKKREGKDPFKDENGIESGYILEYGEKIGLGSREYELKDL